MTSTSIPTFPFDRPVPTEPSPMLSELRNSCPVAPIELPSGHTAWLVTRFDDVKGVLSDKRFSCRAAAHPSSPPFVPFVQLCPSLLSIDGPQHTAARRLLAQGLNPGFIARMRPVVQQIVDNALDDLAAAEPPVDFQEIVSVPIGEQLMAKLLGVEPETVHELAAHVDAAMSVCEIGDEEVSRRWSALCTMVIDILHRKLAEPGDDLLSTIAQANRQQSTMTDEQVVGMLLTVVIGGVDTPIAVITNGLASLLHHRDQYERLVEDPGRVARAVEEIVRFNPATEIEHLRVVTEDVVIAGTALSAGSPAFTSITSANRDSDQFLDPDEFDVERNPNEHIAFGYGPHACPASAYSRMCLTTFFTSLTQRFSQLQLARPFEDLERRGKGLHSVGIKELLVTWPT